MSKTAKWHLINLFVGTYALAQQMPWWIKHATHGKEYDSGRPCQQCLPRAQVSEL